MGLGRSYSVAVTGVRGDIIGVQADIGQGLPSITVTAASGLAETKDRVRAAIMNAGTQLPDRRIILAIEHDHPGNGGIHDLAVAAAILDAAHVFPPQRTRRTVFLGELCLDGRLRRCAGLLPAVLAARRHHHPVVVVPEQALDEVAAVEGIEVLGAPDLRTVIAWLRDERSLPTPAPARYDYPAPRTDLADLASHPDARRALEIAAAGGVHMAILGPSGSGKTLLAQCLPGILPPLTRDQALEVAAVHSTAATPREPALSLLPPYCAPHHSTSVAAMFGGGSSMARAGEAARAHHGVLFLDDAAQWPSRVLDSLPPVCDHQRVVLGHRGRTVAFPARVQMLAASAWCPCDAPTDAECRCQPVSGRRHRAWRTSAWADRIDIWIALDPIDAALSEADTEPSAVVRERVMAARDAAAQRWQSYGYVRNADVPGSVLRQQFRLPAATTTAIEAALHAGSLSARGADSILRLAWTIRDLRGGDIPDKHDVAAALALRAQPQRPTT
ncbi:YifB family Mg chelatase-like AAA ATPase [Nocardia sp. NPDC059691]|uniref:YifB family Mg chelatase-like AAA ATPase n=1 Tax=Nocardia sp. NPDC059691 TaxID=3346908 RepID=UPI0036B472C9